MLDWFEVSIRNWTESIRRILQHISFTNDVVSNTKQNPSSNHSCHNNIFTSDSTSWLTKHYPKFCRSVSSGDPQDTIRQQPQTILHGTMLGWCEVSIRTANWSESIRRVPWLKDTQGRSYPPGDKQHDQAVNIRNSGVPVIALHHISAHTDSTAKARIIQPSILPFFKVFTTETSQNHSTTSKCSLSISFQLFYCLPRRAPVLHSQSLTVSLQTMQMSCSKELIQRRSHVVVSFNPDLNRDAGAESLIQLPTTSEPGHFSQSKTLSMDS